MCKIKTKGVIKIRGYSNYRGRNSFRSRFLFVLIIIFAAAAVIFAGNRLLFSSDGGLLAKLFDQQEEQTDPPALIIVPSTESSSETVPSSEATTLPEEPIEGSAYLRSIYLPDATNSEALETALELAANGSINAVVIDMKHDDGTLAYISETDFAVTAGVNPEDDESVRSSIASLKDAGLHLIARVSAFKDNIVPRKIQYSSVHVRSGVIWLDYNYHTWLDPYSQSACEYISSVSAELCELGFDEILLDHVQFPTVGKTNLLYYEDEATISREEAISSFLDMAGRSVVDAGGTLSVMLDGDIVYSDIDGSGQELSTLANLSNRLYFTRPENDASTDEPFIPALEAAEISDAVVAVTLDGSETADEISELIDSLESVPTGNTFSELESISGWLLLGSGLYDIE